MLDRQRSKKFEMLSLHKALIIIISVLLIYNYYFPSSTIIVSNPKFTLLGPYNTTDYSADDVYDQLIDLKNFSFKINTNPCENYESGLLLMIVVTSNSKNFEHRRTIRATWGKTIDSTKTVFLVGESKNATVSQRIINESSTYGDIVQGSFTDTYRNLTYKHIMGLKWVAHHCPTAKYILKADDDVVVNSKALRKFLAREMSPWGARDLITCQVLENAVAQRSHRSKWRVSPAEYPHHYYPTYCAGWAVLYSQDVVFRLLKEAQQTPYFWIDDVHITGVIAEKIGIPRTPLKGLVLSKHRANMLTNLGPSYAGPFLFGPPDLSVDRVTELWKAIPA